MFDRYLFYEREAREEKLKHLAKKNKNEIITIEDCAEVEAERTDVEMTLDDSGNQDVIPIDQTAIKQLENDENKVEKNNSIKTETEKSEILRRSKQFQTLVPFVTCNVPRQENGIDCGFFVIKFAEMIMTKRPSSTQADINNNFKNILSFCEFSHKTVIHEREKMRDLLDSIVPQYKLSRETAANNSSKTVKDDDSIEIIYKPREIAANNHERVAKTVKDDDNIEIFHNPNKRNRIF